MPSSSRKEKISFATIVLNKQIMLSIFFVGDDALIVPYAERLNDLIVQPFKITVL